jgi:hypothetical protein
VPHGAQNFRGCERQKIHAVTPWISASEPVKLCATLAQRDRVLDQPAGQPSDQNIGRRT